MHLRHPRERVPQYRRKKGVWPKVELELSWTRARSTSPTTQTRAPRVRVIFQNRPSMQSRPPRDRVTQIFGIMHLDRELCECKAALALLAHIDSRVRVPHALASLHQSATHATACPMRSRRLRRTAYPNQPNILSFLPQI